VVKPSLPTDRLAIGLTIFIIGLFKKAVIADFLATIADPVFAAAIKGAVAGVDAWGGTLAYSLQIYFDFSGYCDMAIGMSLLFGIVLPFNFDAPYKSKSIAEFWHRWHITLSRFLRDYLYIPLGGNRRGEARRNYNLILTMLIGGLWHGAGWTFVIWGGLHGLFLIVNHSWDKLGKRVPAIGYLSDERYWAVATLVLTQLCVVVAWVFFRADSLATAHRVVSAMAGLAQPAAGALLVSRADFWLIAAGYLVCLTLPNVNELFRAYDVGLDTYRLPQPFSLLRLRWAMRMPWAVAAATLFAAALVAILASGGGVPFLYFQF
jgi:D-alanyl-lipoteichoic acid acyltransferase DltB (MBOAT superfamily)